MLHGLKQWRVKRATLFIGSQSAHTYIHIVHICICIWVCLCWLLFYFRKYLFATWIVSFTYHDKGIPSRRKCQTKIPWCVCTYVYVCVHTFWFPGSAADWLCLALARQLSQSSRRMNRSAYSALFIYCLFFCVRLIVVCIYVCILVKLYMCLYISLNAEIFWKYILHTPHIKYTRNRAT